jgi:hypothetical protein
MNLSPEHTHGERSGLNWSRVNQWLLWIGLAAAVAWMFFRHNAHLVQLLPFLILLACPLMHLFGHGRHGGHGGHSTGEDRESKAEPRERSAGDRGSNHQP